MTRTMGGNAWFIPRNKYDRDEVIRWCKENLTQKTWHVSEQLSMGVFEVVVGYAAGVCLFTAHWFPTGRI